MELICSEVRHASLITSYLSLFVHSSLDFVWIHVLNDLQHDVRVTSPGTVVHRGFTGLK